MSLSRKTAIAGIVGFLSLGLAAPALAADAGADGVATAAAPVLEVTGRWNLDSITARSNRKFTASAVKPGVAGNPMDDGVLDADTTVVPAPRAAGAGTGALYFPGWKNMPIHPSQSSIRMPHRDYFNPDTREQFLVTAYVRTDDSAAAGSPVKPNAAPNIVQKGLTSDPKGQWKMSVTGDGRVACVFKGRTTPTGTPVQRQAVATIEAKLTPGTNYRLDCDLTRGVVTTSIRTPAGALLASFTSTDAPSTFIIDNTAKIWVGKLPNVKTANNTYAGVVDNLIIQRSTT